MADLGNISLFRGQVLDSLVALAGERIFSCMDSVRAGAYILS
jgi:hypothetical protein